jgi:hypothetical protein
MLNSLKDTFKTWTNFFIQKPIDCVASRLPKKDSPFYNQVMIADRGLTSHRLTLEEFTDKDHLDTRLIFKLVNLTTSESLDLVHAFDKISGTSDENSRAAYLKQAPESAYQPSAFVNINKHSELMDAVEALGSDKLVYSQKQRLDTAKAMLTHSLS